MNINTRILMLKVNVLIWHILTPLSVTDDYIVLLSSCKWQPAEDLNVLQSIMVHKHVTVFCRQSTQSTMHMK